MLTRMVSGFAWVGFLVWTLLCLGLWGVIALGGDVLRWAAGAAQGGDAGALGGILNFLEAFGTILLAWVWIAGTVFIAAAGFVMRKAAKHATLIRMESARVQTGEWGPREMKDVTPPRESDAPDPDMKRLPKH
ncbi:MAG: hypothetical protein NBV67_17505 [Tagaea sp.]|nr:hypothetical protein [Tagaea sp.]